MHCTEILPEFECKGQRSRSVGTNNALSAASPQGAYDWYALAADSSSGWAHFMAARGCCAVVSSVCSMPVGKSAHAV